MTRYVDNVTLTCLTKPNKKGRRAKLINIPESDGVNAPMKLHKTKEESLAQDEITQ